MKKAAALLVFAFVACKSASPPAPAMTADQRYEADARALLTNFNAGRFDDATRNFDATMMANLGPAKLAQFAQQFSMQVGPFKSAGAARFSDSRGYRVVELPAQYERANVTVRVVFDNSGKVAGLFFVPTQ